MMGNVVIVLVRDGVVKRLIAKNVVTIEGHKYYAQKAAGETPAYAFNTMVLGNGPAPTWSETSNYSTLAGAISGSAKAIAPGYPKTNDTDPSNGNGGPNIVTWKFYWEPGDFAADYINQAVITVSNPSSDSPILCGFNMTAFDKTSDDALTIFVNHKIRAIQV
jgi:hypothetical protein